MPDTTADANSGAGQYIPFSDWLRTFADAEPPIRDLAQDFIMGSNDGTNGSFYATPESFREMLESEGASYDALRTFEDAADEWSLLTGITRDRGR